MAYISSLTLAPCELDHAKTLGKRLSYLARVIQQLTCILIFYMIPIAMPELG